MTPLVWASLALAALYFGAWYGIPMWMTFKRPERHPDFSEARAYLRAKAALARGESVITVPARRDDDRPAAHDRDPRDRARPPARRGRAGRRAQPPGRGTRAHPCLRMMGAHHQR